MIRTPARVDATDQAGFYRCFNHNPSGIFCYGGAFIYAPNQGEQPVSPAPNLLKLRQPCVNEGSGA